MVKLKMGHSDTVARSCALKLKIINNVAEIPVYRNGTKEISIITISDSRECQNRRTYGPNRAKYQTVRRS